MRKGDTMGESTTSVKPGTGVLNYVDQERWLDNYVKNKGYWFKAAHPNKTVHEYKAFEAGIRIGWNALHALLTFQDVINTDWDGLTDFGKD